MLLVQLLFVFAVAVAERGIITSIGNRQHFASAYGSLRILRTVFHCDLPVQCGYFGVEIPSVVREHSLMAEMDIEFVDLTEWVDWSRVEPHKYLRYASKPALLLASRFDEVLALDADTILFQSPDALFESDFYTAKGALLLRDSGSDQGGETGRNTWTRSGAGSFAPFMADTPWDNWNPSSMQDLFADTPGTVGQRTFHHDGHVRQQLLAGAIHFVESSVYMWNKRHHKAATSVLAYWMSNFDIYLNMTAKTWGEKELYFLAQEAVGTEPTFSPWGQGYVLDAAQYAYSQKPLHVMPDRSKSILSMNKAKDPDTLSNFTHYIPPALDFRAVDHSEVRPLPKRVRRIISLWRKHAREGLLFWDSLVSCNIWYCPRNA